MKFEQTLHATLKPGTLMIIKQIVLMVRLKSVFKLKAKLMPSNFVPFNLRSRS